MRTEAQTRVFVNTFALIADLLILAVGLLVMPAVFGEGFPLKVFIFCTIGYLIVEVVKWIMFIVILIASGVE